MKFKYGDDVKVISGFYEGLNGYVTDKKVGCEITISDYYIKMEGLKGTRRLIPSDWISEEDLEKR